ncbi:MAG: ROK family protein [Mariprofundaceae bacterium]|nr:ROK family protein [Mariprofundaceae bacterium]
MILAVDVGGTNIRTALIASHGGTVQELRSRVSLGDRGVSENDLIEKLSALFSEIISSHNDISAIGIGFPGFFSAGSGILLSSPNLPQLHNVDLAGRLSEAVSLPVSMQNDALCAAIGEHRFGAGKGHANLLHITLGTGIGGGLILNGVPYTGESGMAMEFGHLRVAGSDLPRSCGCGGSGCVEAYASATAVSAQYFERSGIQTDAGDIYERACKGDKHAKEIIESAGHCLGMAIAQAIKLLDIHTVTISGGFAGAWPLLHPAIIKSLDTELIPPLKGKTTVLRSTLDDTAGLLGAAALIN